MSAPPMQRARRRQPPSTKTVKSGAMNKNKFQKHQSQSHVSATAQLRWPRPSQWRQRQFRRWCRTWTMGPAKTPLPRLSGPPDQPSPSPRQQPVAWTPLLHHGHVRNVDFAQKKLTSRTPSCVGVEHRDSAHKVVVHRNIHGDFDAPPLPQQRAVAREAFAHVWAWQAAACCRRGRQAEACWRQGWQASRSPAPFSLRASGPPSWRTPGVFVERLDDPSPSLPIQQHQHSTRKGKFSSHELIKM
jgi:hypothetical protein